MRDLTITNQTRRKFILKRKGRDVKTIAREMIAVGMYSSKTSIIDITSTIRKVLMPDSTALLGKCNKPRGVDPVLWAQLKKENPKL